MMRAEVRVLPRAWKPLKNMKKINLVPGRTRTGTVNFSAIKVLARWDFLSYPEGYPSQSRAVVGPPGICWGRMSHLVTLGT